MAECLGENANFEYILDERLVDFGLLLTTPPPPYYKIHLKQKKAFVNIFPIRS